MKGLHGIIFSHEKHNNLRDLTANRMPASVPFAGRYRIIDFILSSMVNAGITDVAWCSTAGTRACWTTWAPARTGI